jgi:hypothetical protein
LLNFKGASVTAPSDKLAKFLCFCGFKGEIATVKLLNECEADLEVSNYDYRTIGHLAAAEAKFDLLFYLAASTNFNFEI